MNVNLDKLPGSDFVPRKILHNKCFFLAGSFAVISSGKV